MEQSASDVWVPVLVRLEDLEEVSAWIAGRESARERPGIAAQPLSVNVPRPAAATAQDAAWPVEQLKRLITTPSATAERWVRALDVCSEAADGSPLSTSEVARRSGMTVNEWRDACRKISRHLKKHFPEIDLDADGNPIWPLADSTMPGTSEVQWSMSPELAVRWRQARGGQTS